MIIDETAATNQETTKSQFNILDLSKNIMRTNMKKTEEKNLIILGEKGSGKTSIFNCLTNTTNKDTYIPTCGINYSYMRYTPGNKKFILNIYEIGGGIKNLELVKTIINEKNLQSTQFILCLDFANPKSILDSFKEYIRELHNILKSICNQEEILNIIENKRFRYKDINSNDFKRINFFPAEIIVIGCKYDYLEKIDV
jgi:GTPase SAR1 family protein